MWNSWQYENIMKQMHTENTKFNFSKWSNMIKRVCSIILKSERENYFEGIDFKSMIA